MESPAMVLFTTNRNRKNSLLKMKKMKNLILHIIVSLLASFSLGLSQDVHNVKDNAMYVRKIANEIDYFSKSYGAILKKYMRQNFSQISKEELDSLRVILEPHYIVCKECQDTTLLLKPYPSMTEHCLIKDPMYGTTYSCFHLPEFNEDTVIMGIRLYTSQNVQKYYIEIVSHSGIYVRVGSDLLESNYKTLLKQADLKNPIPEWMPVFSIYTDIGMTSLERCFIYKNKIYSLDCMQEKFGDVALNIILQKDIQMIDECDLDGL